MVATPAHLWYRKGWRADDANSIFLTWNVRDYFTKAVMDFVLLPSLVGAEIRNKKAYNWQSHVFSLRERAQPVGERMRAKEGERERGSEWGGGRGGIEREQRWCEWGRDRREERKTWQKYQKAESTPYHASQTGDRRDWGCRINGDDRSPFSQRKLLYRNLGAEGPRGNMAEGYSAIIMNFSPPPPLPLKIFFCSLMRAKMVRRQGGKVQLDYCCKATKTEENLNRPLPSTVSNHVWLR